MTRISIPLIGDRAIVQGETYQALSLDFPGDLTTWECQGEIKTKLRQDGGELLAVFSFAPASYDPIADVTTIHPRLTPAQTSAIPSTKARSYLYDVKLISPAGETIKTVPAIVEVTGEVTANT